MKEIAIYITLSDVAAPMCEDPIVAQTVADALNGPDSHCVKGNELGQWFIEEPALVGENGIGRGFSVEVEGKTINVIIEDAYCFHGNDMPVGLLLKLPTAVFNNLIEQSV